MLKENNYIEVTACKLNKACGVSFGLPQGKSSTLYAISPSLPQVFP